MTEREAIDILWEYHHVNHQLAPADIIFVLGSNDPRIAEYAAELYHKQLAPIILFSGGSGRFTDRWAQSEADIFANIAKSCGVPNQAILIENKSTNTGENILFSRNILTSLGYPQNLRLLALQKPYMERRTFATLRAQWTEAQVIVSSPPFSFDNYLTDILTYKLVVSAIVGDFQRIIEYPKQGFAIEQPIPDNTQIAFQTLIERGFISQLLSSDY
ncbi:MAG: YdcF family protein [Akkermansia sp.]